MRILKFVPLLLAILLTVSCDKKKTRAEIEADFQGQNSSEVSEEMLSDKDRISNHKDNTDFDGNLKELQEKEEEAKKLAEELKKKKAEEEKKAKESSDESSENSESESIQSENSETTNSTTAVSSGSSTTTTAPVTPPVNTQQEQTIKVDPAKKDVIVDGQAQ